MVTDKTKRHKSKVLKNTNKKHGNPYLTGKIIEREKNTGIEAETSSAKKPDENDKKKNNKKGS